MATRADAMATSQSALLANVAPVLQAGNVTAPAPITCSALLSSGASCRPWLTATQTLWTDCSAPGIDPFPGGRTRRDEGDAMKTQMLAAGMIAGTPAPRLRT